jgi:hypothetical protein
MSTSLAQELDSSKTNCRSVFFVRVRPDERDVILAHAAGELLRGVESPGEFPRPILSWSLGAWDNQKLQTIDAVPLENASLTLLDALHSVAPEPPEAWHSVLTELAASDLFAFEPFRERDDYVERGRWRLSWCLPPVTSLEPDMAELLPDLLLDHLDPERAVHVNTAHFGHDAAPIPVAPAGVLDLPVTPIPIAVPRDFEEIRGSAQEAVRALAEHTIHALTERVECLGDLVGSARPQGSAAFLETSPDGRSATIHNDLFVACRFLAEAVEERLPRFIRGRYSLDVMVLPIAEWDGDRRIVLNLVDNTDGSRRFDIEDVAEGHRLWLQLALLEAINATDQMRLTLERHLELDLPGLEDAYWEVREAMPDPDNSVDGAEVARRGGRTAYLAALEDFRAGALRPQQHSLAGLVSEIENDMTDWLMGASMTVASGVQLLEPTWPDPLSSVRPL